MTTLFHAVYDGKVLHPMEKIDLEPNLTYRITIETTLHERNARLKNLLDDIIGTANGQPDWSSEHDHYLYGIPKPRKQQ